MLTAEAQISIAAAKLARMVALSETFRNGKTFEQARQRVLARFADDFETRPFAVVSQGLKHTFSLIAAGDQNYFEQSGGLFLFLTVDTHKDFYNDSVQAERHALNYFGRVTEDVALLAGRDDPTSEDGMSHLCITRIDRVVAEENDETTWNSLGRFWWCGYEIEWGF